MCVCVCVCVCEYSRMTKKVMPFFFSSGTCIIQQNEAGLLWITSLLLNIVTIFHNTNVSLSNQNMYPCFVKFCGLFFESFITAVFTSSSLIFLKNPFFPETEEMIDIRTFVLEIIPFYCTVITSAF